MDNILVGIIVAGAVVFTIRSFIRTYKGQGECSCSSSCSSCSTSRKASHCSLDQPFKIMDKS